MTDLISTDSAFSPEEKRALETLAGQMIPATDSQPGADDPSILSVVFERLAPHQAMVQQALAGFAGDVGALRVSKPAFIGAFQFAVVTAYYADERVKAAIGLKPEPPHPGGWQVPETDWDNLLENVRARGKVYRDA